MTQANGAIPARTRSSCNRAASWTGVVGDPASEGYSWETEGAEDWSLEADGESVRSGAYTYDETTFA